MEEAYKIKMNSYCSRVYIFEVTKSCGYSEFVFVNKNETLDSLHKNVFNLFEKKYKLYVLNKETNNKVYIPELKNVLLKNYILENQCLFVPIYPLPLKVVYKIYFDEHCNENM